MNPKPRPIVLHMESDPLRKGIYVLASRRNNLSLAGWIFDTPANVRAASAEDAFYEVLHNLAAEALCLDHLEILFDRSLMLQAVDLVRNASRRFLLIASWPGTVDGEGLVFAPPEHPSHLRMPICEMECPVHVLSPA